MTKTILFFAAFFPAGILFSAGVDSRVFTPYFNMDFSESAFVPSEGDVFTGGDITADVGLLADINGKNSLLGLYGFNYEGPGFQPQEQGQFTERSMSHNLNIEYKRFVNEKIRLRPQISGSVEYRRSGANESWENGLYNTKSLGFGLAADYFFGDSGNKSLSLEYVYRNVKFPNYTDLLLEFQQAGASSELSGGLYDQHYHQLGLSAGWEEFFGGVNYVLQKYKNQRIIEPDGTGGGVYGDTLQKDKTLSMYFGLTKKLWIFKMSPSLAYSMRRSNQNFVRYKYLGDTSPEFVENNYDYNEITLSAPLDLLITGKWALSGSLSLIKRNYTDRPARDENNVYKSEEQSNLMTTLSFGVKRRMNEIAYMRLEYLITAASSNNKFERYLPYNYTGNALSLSYQISY